MNVLQVCGEKSRFEKLMEYFCREDSNIDFMVKMLLRVQSPGTVWMSLHKKINDLRLDVDI